MKLIKTIFCLFLIILVVIEVITLCDNHREMIETESETEGYSIEIKEIVIIDETTEEETTAEETTVEETTAKETEKETEKETPNERWYPYNDGKKCTVTYYCLCEKCCGKNWSKALCADGTTPERYVTVANGSLPFGTKVYIDGIGYRWVHDRGSAVGKNHFDIYVGVQNHEFALSFGKQKRKVWVIK